ncbi:7368_t:CDS:2 [Dentiscutata heterogama]|uniref:7368_t:CDS:1 n=1 Tax=Dentiscutata heterogama TaxID=1316150 RepID=A0ACA9K7Q0_9GLOM|nr:7368_t:CDS:2 [Dentiscutata heterogama]
MDEGREFKDAGKISTSERIMKTSEAKNQEVGIKNGEKEKQSLIEIETNKLITIEKITKAFEAEKLEMIKTQEAAQWEIKQHKQSKLCTENMYSVRGGLEYIRSKILSNNNSSIIEEPVDKILTH